VVVGLGLNVVNPIPPPLVETAIALASLAAGVAVSDLAQPLAEAIAAAGLAAGPLSEDELARWARRDWLQGRSVSGALSGAAAGIAPDGALLVRQDSGLIGRIEAGDVVTAGQGPR
jgi:biotin-(acetyl-CoA carboxylase) ligase